MKNTMIQLIGYGAVMCMAFFPAYVWYMDQYAWIGYMTTIVFALLTYIPYIRNYQTRWLLAIISIAAFGLVIESIGVLTCFPYWCFAYSNQLWPKILNIVPWLLIATWPPLVIGIRSMVKNYINRWYKRRIVWAIGLVMVDLILDPLAVLMGLWSFDGGGFWRGVPLSNFGWRLLSGFVSVMIIDLFLWKQTNNKLYLQGMICTLCFFVGYGIWRLILSI